MNNLEEVFDKLAEAMMPISDDEVEQKSNRELRLETFIEIFAPPLLEELRVLRNQKNLLELEVFDLRNRIEELE